MAVRVVKMCFLFFSPSKSLEEHPQYYMKMRTHRPTSTSDDPSPFPDEGSSREFSNAERELIETQKVKCFPESCWVRGYWEHLAGRCGDPGSSSLHTSPDGTLGRECPLSPNYIISQQSNIEKVRINTVSNLIYAYMYIEVYMLVWWAKYVLTAKEWTFFQTCA